jgi:hypothetical protein
MIVHAKNGAASPRLQGGSVEAFARSLAPAAIELLMGIMRNPDAAMTARITAARAVLAVGNGACKGKSDLPAVVGVEWADPLAGND